ncbi:deleted in malignant brain tumors 1 protein-like [Lytechinus pictus]|uniref:deleted in malignant brain tumors 1 protein-like n=1 Tax=Lytechinus pictus TaxID=7653 RepID=UPI0030BA0B69
MIFVVYLVVCFFSIPVKAQIEGVRLFDGEKLGEGRVEVFYQGAWGTVCDDNWDINDANVVCQSLGLGNALDAFSEARFGEGTGSIVLDEISCTGTEAEISDCGNAGLGVHDCSHWEDAGVRCQKSVRLVDGGDDPNGGRVEVYYNGAWGTVCEDWWDVLDAQVVCRSLGYDDGEAEDGGVFPPGSGDIIVDDALCHGTESELRDCHMNNGDIGNHNCVHTQDAGVRCSYDEN